MKRGIMKIAVSLFVLFFIALNASAQVNYSVSFSGGLSNLHELNKAYVYDEYGYIIVDRREIRYGNYYNYSSMFSIGASVIEKIRQSNFSFEQGIGFELRSFYNNSDIDPSYNVETKWKETYYSCNIPIKIRYKLFSNLSVFTGVSNILNLGNNAFDNDFFETNFYQARGIIGFDITLYENFILGSEYGYDITPYSKMKDYDLTNRFDKLSFKIGYLFK